MFELGAVFWHNSPSDWRGRLLVGIAGPEIGLHWSRLDCNEVSIIDRSRGILTLGCGCRLSQYTHQVSHSRVERCQGLKDP